MIDRSPNKAWQVRDDFMLMKPLVSVATKKTWWLIHHFRRRLDPVNFRQDFWVLFLGARKKNWPIADWGVLNNHPRSNCGTHISAPAPFSFF